MVTKVMRQPNSSNAESTALLHKFGLITAAVSLVLELLLWFVIPTRHSFTSGIESFIVGLCFLLGIIAALVGRVMLNRQSKALRNGNSDRGSS